MKAPGGRLLRCLSTVALLPLFGLVFWAAATVASSLPGLIVVGVNVHGLGVASYAAGSSQRPAPLSIQVLEDAQGDASGSHPSNAPTTTPAPTPVAPAHSPTPPPPPPPTARPSPTPSVPAPTPTPAPATIGGQVLDSQTLLPIAAATVSVSPGGKSALTDTNGNFSIGVNPGSYTVMASAPAYNSTSQPVSVANGQKASVLFKLVNVAAYGSLIGTVTDSASQNPIMGATVTISLGMIRVTDANGNFSYALVLNGTYTLTVSATGYVTQSRPITIKPGQTTSVQIGLVHT